MSWPIRKLGELCQIRRGQSPRPISAHLTKREDGVNWIKIGDATGGGKYITETKQKILRESAEKLVIVQPGDFIMTNSMSFGTPYILNTTGCVHDGWLIFSDYQEHLNRDYMYHLLKSPDIYRQFLGMIKGSTVNNLKIETVKETVISLPPLDEQKRIAAIIDKADDIKQGAQEIQDSQEYMIQSTFVEMFGEPSLNPKKYPFTDVESICRLVTDGEHTTPVRIDAGIKLLSARNVKNGFIDLEEKCDYISMEEYERISKRCHPEINDVLISCSGTVGRVTTIRIDEPFSLVRSVLLLKPDFDKINSTYLEVFLRTSYSKHQISRRVRTSAQANLFIGRAKSLPVMLPTLEIQQKFEKIVLNILLLYESLTDGVKMSDLLIDSSVQSLINQ